MDRKVSDAAIRRLPRYYRHLKELENEGYTKVSSKFLSERMNLTASQIRQDFNRFGGIGQQGYGYRIREITYALACIMGQDNEHFYNTVIIGAGNMGRAVGRYDGFAEEGLRILAYFDQASELIGQKIGNKEVHPMEQLKAFVRQNHVEIGVITVPAAVAQAVADMLVGAGVKGIWNFAPVDLKVPEGVALESIHLTDSLLELTYRMNESVEPGHSR